MFSVLLLFLSTSFVWLILNNKGAIKTDKNTKSAGCDKGGQIAPRFVPFTDDKDRLQFGYVLRVIGGKYTKKETVVFFFSSSLVVRTQLE